ncbi:AMP-binding protein [Aquibium carbonis]|nr:AMP-binding protein [Aquibium carbonis]
MASAEPLGPFPLKMTDRLHETARISPERPFLKTRDPAGGWRSVTYGEAQRAMAAVGQALLDRGLGPERPVAILSGNTPEHALLMLACTEVGVPAAPVNPALLHYRDAGPRLSGLLALLSPGLVLVDDPDQAERILPHLPDGADLVVAKGAEATAHTGFSALLETRATAEVARAAAAVTPDAVAKLLFTSGSTGSPKAVVVTNRMWCANQQMLLQALPFLADRPLELLDWLPWHHASGANVILGLVLQLGGTLYVDDGRPVPGGIDRTVRNLRDVAPSAYFSVPRGFAELMPHLEADPGLARRFFGSVSMLFYSGAGMPGELERRIQRTAVAATGLRVPILSAYGATETAPFALVQNWPANRTGLAGLPLPGVDLKLVPKGDKYEARVRGPIVTPGYWRAPEMSAALFDEEGYLCLGDTLSMVDPQRPDAGLAFEGRIAEDFKLTSGTWVNVGGLRDAFLREAGLLVADVVITGEGRDMPGALVFLSPVDCARHLGVDAIDAQALERHPAIRAIVAEALDALAQRAPASSTHIARALLIGSPPSAAQGEITDKGSISQKGVLRARAPLIEMLYGPPASPILQAGKTQTEDIQNSVG